MGYESRELNLRGDKAGPLVIGMEPAINLLDQATVTSGKFEKPLSEVTVSLEVIKPELLRANNTNTLSDILDRIPGVSIVDGQPNIRGGSGWSYGAGSRVLLLQDDIPILQADAGRPNWKDIPVENTGQVEILKGAGSALYGSSALNGIINFRTDYARSRPETHFSTFTDIKMAPNDEQRKWWDTPPRDFGASLVHKQKFGAFDLVASGHYRNTSGPVRDAYSNYGRGSLKTRYRINDRLSAGVNGGVYYGKGRNYFYWSNAYEGAFIGDSITAANGRSGRFNIDPFVTYFDNTGATHKYRGRYMDILNDNDENQGNESRLMYNDYQYQNKFEGIDLVMTAGITATFSRVTAEIYGDTSYTTSNIAPYAQFEKKFGKLNLSAGVRLERNQINGPETFVTSEDSIFFNGIFLGFTEVDTFSLSGGSVSEAKPVFRAGLNYQLGKATFLRASWGQGYRFATIAERFVETSAGGIRVIPNPNLESETGWTSELAVKQGFKVNEWTGFVDAALFYTEYQNMMEFNLDPGSQFPDLGFSSQNIGDTRIYGIEITGGSQGKFGNVPLRLNGGYTYIVPKFQDFTEEISAFSSSDENILKYRSQHSAKMDIETGYKKWRIGSNLIYNSHMEAIDAIFSIVINDLDEFRGNHDNGYVQWDLRTSYELIPGMRLALIIKNLNNATFMPRPGSMGNPRSVAVRVDYDF